MKTSKPPSHQSLPPQTRPTKTLPPQIDVEHFLKSSAPTALETTNQLTQPDLIRALLQREKRKTVIKALNIRLKALTPPPLNSKTKLAALQKEFSIWREHKGHRDRIPEALWSKAVHLTRQYSVSILSKELRLSYAELKKRASERKEAEPSVELPTEFVEFTLPTSDTPKEVLVEALHPNGSSLKLTLKNGDEQFLLSLAAAFWRQAR